MKLKSINLADSLCLVEKIKNLIKELSFFSFNQVNRDQWVAAQADGLQPGSRVLDVGAGSCPYRIKFSHCEYFAQDFVALNGAQLRHGGYGSIDYVCDAMNIPVPDSSFDVVLCTEMLEHVPEPIKVIKEFARILRPGGVLLLTAPLGSGIHQEPYHFYGGFTLYWYERFLAEFGFSHIQVEANGGFFRHFGQESLRLILMVRDAISDFPIVAKLICFPLWIMFVPFFGLLIPGLCIGLDRFDKNKKFTVGYHVKAMRKNIN